MATNKKISALPTDAAPARTDFLTSLEGGTLNVKGLVSAYLALALDTDLTFSNNTTGDVSTLAHGYTPKAPNDGTVLLSSGLWGAFPFAAATVDTDETQAAGAGYGDLATPGPSVTLTMKGTTAILLFGAGMYRTGGAGNTGIVSVAVSGASTVAASDATSVASASGGASFVQFPFGTRIYTGLTPGVNVFTLKYRNDAGVTWHFARRSLAVFAP